MGEESTTEQPVEPASAEPADPARFYCGGAKFKDDEGRPYCDYRAPRRWLGRCPKCGEWRPCLTMRGFGPGGGDTKRLPTAADLAVMVTLKPFSTGISEVDEVLGGGLFTDSCVLFAGDPGVGKTTLLLTIANNIAEKRGRVVYAHGEDSSSSLARYVQRLGLASPRLTVIGVDHGGSNVKRIMEEVEEKPKLLVIDAAQTVFYDDVDGDAGSQSQLKSLANDLNDYVKTRGVPVILVSHVTQSGDFVGTRTLRHLVDTLLYLRNTEEEEQLEGARVLHIAEGKNRNGNASAKANFRMTAEGVKPRGRKGRLIQLAREFDEGD